MTSSGKFDVYIIHLRRAGERRAFMEQQLAISGLSDPNWIEAVDGGAERFVPRSGLRIQREDVLLEHNWDGRVYVAAEDAIFQSHLLALRTFLEGGKPFGLIVEDDAELSANIAGAIGGAIDFEREWDIVSMGGFRTSGRRPAIRVARLGDYDLVASLNPCAGLAVYLVSRVAAQRLLAGAEGIHEPFDNYLHAQWRHGLRILDVAPFPARQGPLGSMRERKRSPRRSSPVSALIDWKRHLAADLIGRYLRRWVRQVSTYGVGGLTLAKWSNALRGRTTPAKGGDGITRD